MDGSYGAIHSLVISRVFDFCLSRLSWVFISLRSTFTPTSCQYSEIRAGNSGDQTYCSVYSHKIVSGLPSDRIRIPSGPFFKPISSRSLLARSGSYSVINFLSSSVTYGTFCGRACSGVPSPRKRVSFTSSRLMARDMAYRNLTSP